MIISYIVALLASIYLVSGIVITDTTRYKLDLKMQFSISYRDSEVTKPILDQYDLTKVNTTEIISPAEESITVVVNDFKDKLTFDFKYDKDGMLLMDLSYVFHPSSHSKSNESEITSTWSQKLNVKKGSTDSYVCQLPIEADMKIHSEKKDQHLDLQITISEARIQAFGLVKKDFGKGVPCAADKTPPQGNYTVTEPMSKTPACVNLTAAMDLTIQYQIKDSKGKIANATTNIALPQGTVTTDACEKSHEQPMSISFYDVFNLTFTFNKTDAKDYKVYLANITLDFDTTDAFFFPGATGNTSYSLSLHNTDRMYSYSKGAYFKCLAHETYSLDQGNMRANLSTTKFRYMAYNFEKTQPLLDGKNYEQCPDDVKVSDIVPIAVGAALGALVIIVLIAYLIGRRKTHKGYESV